MRLFLPRFGLVGGGEAAVRRSIWLWASLIWKRPAAFPRDVHLAISNDPLTSTPAVGCAQTPVIA
jgi:hypothetical protein